MINNHHIFISKKKNHFFLIPVITFFTACIIKIFDQDYNYFLLINHISFFTGDIIWEHLTILGDVLILCALILILATYRFKFITSFIIGGIITAIVVHSLKFFLSIPRPPFVFSLDTFHLIGPQLNFFACPSGHTASIFLFCGIIALFFLKSWVTSITFCLAILVGISRIVVGVHWPFDVCLGGCIGWCGAILGMFLSDKWINYSNHRIELVMRLMMIGIVINLFFYNTGYKHTIIMQYSITILSLIFGLYSIIELVRKKYYEH